MKILLVCNEFGYSSGVTTYIINLASKLSIKNTVSLLTSGGTATNINPDIGIFLIIMKELNYEKRSYTKFILAIIKCAILIYRNKYDIIHVNDHYTANIIKYSTPFLSTVKIQTVHSNFFQENKLKKYNADYYIFVNQHMLEFALKDDLSVKMISKVIYNGIDWIDYKLIKNRPIKSKLHITCMSRLEFDKGIHNVIQTISMLPKKYKENIVFSIAGRGSYENTLKTLSKKLNVDTLFLGEIINKEELLLATDIFIIASIKDSFGYTLLEAAQLDCFIITSNYEGVQNIFSDKIDGFIYDRNSLDDLKNKIIEAINLGTRRIHYSNNFKSKVNEKFNADLMVTETEKVYKKCLQIKL